METQGATVALWHCCTVWMHCMGCRAQQSSMEVDCLASEAMHASLMIATTRPGQMDPSALQLAAPTCQAIVSGLEGSELRELGSPAGRQGACHATMARVQQCQLLQAVTLAPFRRMRTCHTLRELALSVPRSAQLD